MAKSKTLMSIIMTITLTFLFLLVAAEDPPFHQYISPTSLDLQKDKLSHFHFYWHIVFSGPKPTAVEVVKAQANSSTLFGRVVIADDPLTKGPELGSKLVGKAQGMYGFAGQNEVSLVMIFNLAFTEGKYNGSTITLEGRNLVFSKVREMPIVGGSGVFRFARGYAQFSTYSFDEKTGDSVLEYNLYVFHY